METVWRHFKDKPDMIREVVRRGNKTEINEWESKLQRNLDIPDNISYHEMGIESRRNTWLDVSERGDGTGCMDDRHFREHCVVYGQNLFFIHQKMKQDMQPALQLRPEWIEEKMECRFEDACTISEAWKCLGFGKWMINKMMFGYYDDSELDEAEGTVGNWKNGLQFAGPAGGYKFARYFEELARDLDDCIDRVEAINGIRGHYYDVSQRMIESGEWYAQYLIASPDTLDQMKWIEHQAIMEIDEEARVVDDINEVDGIDEIDGFVNHLGDEMQVMLTADAFGINRLYDGNDSINQELINEIKEASVNQIKKIQRRFYPSRTGYTGVTKKAEYWWMSSQQKSVAWEFIKARKDELAQYPLSQYSLEVLQTYIKGEEIAFNIKRAIIASYCAGNSFNLYGEVIKWRKRPRQNEIFAIWAEMNRLSKK